MKPLYPFKGIISFCRRQFQKGLPWYRFWMLPSLYRKEMQFQKEFEECLK